MARLKLNPFGLVTTTIGEAQKVIWPTRETLVKHMIMVIASVAVAMLIFASLDLGLTKLVELAIQQ